MIGSLGAVQEADIRPSLRTLKALVVVAVRGTVFHLSLCDPDSALEADNCTDLHNLRENKTMLCWDSELAMMIGTICGALL